MEMVFVVLPTLIGNRHRRTPEPLGKPATRLSFCHRLRFLSGTCSCIANVHPARMRPYACAMEPEPSLESVLVAPTTSTLKSIVYAPSLA